MTALDSSCAQSFFDESINSKEWLEKNLRTEQEADRWREVGYSDAEIFSGKPIPPEDYKKRKQGQQRIIVYGKLLTIAQEKSTSLKLSGEDFVCFRDAKEGDVNLSDILNVVCTLKSLVDLTINGEEITSLPNELKNLSKLERLDISETNITSLPEIITNMATLQFIDISNTLIDKLPNRLSNLRLKQLIVAGTYLPIPLYIRQNTTDANIILKELESIESIQNEIKVIIVGQGGVGKTSLIHRLIHDKFNPNETETDGIVINQWIVKKPSSSNETNCAEIIPSGEQKANSKIRINFWDFGGQEIMHATHQFFFTKRSLYLLVVNVRQTQEENRVEYWLNAICLSSGESPVIIVGNKIDQNPFDIDQVSIKNKHSNIVGILPTSAASGEGIEALRLLIFDSLMKFPSIVKSLPRNWLKIKNRLETLACEQNFITYDCYLDLCASNGISDETSQRTLIGFLHDLGVVLHFQDDPRLEALGILNPQWVTNGVYKILNAHTLFQNKGVLTVSMLDEILNLPEYPRGKRLFIVDMMKKFELCYDIESDKTFLVPDLLPKDQPALNFNGIPAFEYAYPVLPSSVITRFIVRMNQKIDDGFVWRTGVVLKIGENKALVKADIEDRKITIAIDGQEHTRRDALSAIRYQLDEIHASIKGLNPKKRVPIPDAPNAEPLDYDYLLQLERDGELEILPVKDGSRLVKVNVRKLLSGVVSEAERKQSAGNTTNIYVSGDVSGNIVTGDENEVRTSSQ